MGTSSSSDNCGNDLSLPGEIRTIQTHLGDMKVRIIGQLGDGKEPVVCLHGAKISLVEEWVPIASKLAEGNFVVCIINFHSNPKTVPSVLFGGIQPPDLSKIIIESVMKGIFNTDKIILMAKSWGGYMAGAHTAAHPETVSKLVLQAPAFTTVERVSNLAAATTAPLLLCWAKNDGMMSYSSSKLWMDAFGTERATLYTADTGGHAITDEYAAPIQEFLKS